MKSDRIREIVVSNAGKLRALIKRIRPNLGLNPRRQFLAWNKGWNQWSKGPK